MKMKTSEKCSHFPRHFILSYGLSSSSSSSILCTRILCNMYPTKLTKLNTIHKTQRICFLWVLCSIGWQITTTTGMTGRIWWKEGRSVMGVYEKENEILNDTRLQSSRQTYRLQSFFQYCFRVLYLSDSPSFKGDTRDEVISFLLFADNLHK